MCGIVGFVGESPAQELLLEGLSRLEYRGYDSAGICMLDSGLQVTKAKGRIAQLRKKLSASSSSIGIAHTRWATHGAPTEGNAHPHISGKVAIVHNGIIENHTSLREKLIRDGYRFVSQTDSEVLAHLIAHCYEGDLLSAVSTALSHVQGAFGLAVVHADHKEIIAARRGSPLILGLGDGFNMVASDVAAVLAKTRSVVYLRDDEIARITVDSYDLRDLSLKRQDAHIDEITWDLDQIEKGGFDHFMLKEIYEQPSSLQNRLAGRIRDGKLHLSVDVKQPDRIVILACGTSYYAGLIGKYVLEGTLRIPVEVDYASEFRYRTPVLRESDLVIVISQSGETADTLEALRIAKKAGCQTLGLVNVVGSTIAREVDCGVYLHAGPEIGVASTKAFTAQVLSLNLLALYFKQEFDGVFDEKWFAELMRVPELVSETLELAPRIKKLAEEFVEDNHFLYLGRGVNFPVALEGALKLKEISYIHAEGYPAAEMKHGPIALIDDKLPVFFIAPNDDSFEKVLSNIQETRARGGRIIVLTNHATHELEELADYLILVPHVREEISPILNTVPLQLFSYYVSTMRDIDVDKPRNLAKSVTVE